jgi:hypothetical protein
MVKKALQLQGFLITIALQFALPAKFQQFDSATDR